jgi:flagellar L-ring protein precursor FlgH
MTRRERELLLRCIVLMAGVIFFSLMAAVRAHSADYADPREAYDPWGLDLAGGGNGYISPDDMEASRRLRQVVKGNRPLYFRKKANRQYDSVTIVIDESTESEISSGNDLSRDASNSMNINSLLFPKIGNGWGVRQTGAANGDPVKTLDWSTSRAHTSDSTIERSQEFSTTLTGEVLEVQKNGYLVVQARKRINVNGEEQTVTVTVIVNPDHMDSNSSVNAEYLIDMRVEYTGKGPMSRMDRRGWGSKIIDFINPF